jgi:hypothetical protein|tara:strand:+ start:3723 stop:3884 length:162 start_codon:yes stop_codon:yes gene_type:complete
MINLYDHTLVFDWNRNGDPEKKPAISVYLSDDKDGNFDVNFVIFQLANITLLG